MYHGMKVDKLDEISGWRSDVQSRGRGGDPSSSFEMMCSSDKEARGPVPRGC